MKRLLIGLLLVISIVVTVAASVDNLRFPYSIDFSAERASPGDHISEEQIKVYNDRVVINIPNVQWATFTDTNSMDPLFDQGANTLEVRPAKPADIEVGDIISYYFEEDIIVHRVVQVGEDNEGTFYILQGDNNDTSDPDKVRFEQVHGVVIGILY